MSKEMATLVEAILDGKWLHIVTLSRGRYMVAFYDRYWRSLDLILYNKEVGPYG